MGNVTGARDWGDWIRRDVAAVPPLGGYAAKRCPVRTQLDVLKPGDRAGVSEFLRSLGERGQAFEAEVFAHLAEELEIVPIDGPDAADRAEREAATVEAMARGDEVITGGRLPTDEEGRRVGEPDMLVRVGAAQVDGRWRYAPLDVKSHQILRADSGADVVVQSIGELAVPGDGAGVSPDGRRDGTAKGDVLQLAHYHRMLQACGHAVDGDVWGGIIGSEGQPVWYRLDEPLWTTPTSDPKVDTRRRSSLEVYDFEFGFRLDIAAVALEHAADPTVPLLVDPMDCSECPECPWRNHCWPQLDAAGDVSRLPGVTYQAWKALRDAELGTIDDLTASTVESIDGIADGRIAELRLQARARSGDQVAYLRPGATGDVPAADVEVDIDMENVSAGAYLWGATVTVRRDGLDGIEAGHRAFRTWSDPLDDAAITTCFGEFWSWLTDLRGACEAQGASFVAFCWSQSAENRFLRQGGELLGQSGAVEDFIASDQWVDLLAWFKSRFVTGHGNGLKTVAQALGFTWRDEDPGGAASMVWYQEAVGGEEPSIQPARDRLIAYNEDDVRATLAVREAVRAGHWTTPPTP